MRSPDRPPRRRRRNTPPTSNNGLASVEPSNSEVYPQLLNAKDLDAIQAFDDHANVKYISHLCYYITKL